MAKRSIAAAAASAALSLLLCLSTFAQKTPDYKIGAIKAVPFDEQTGKFGDEIKPEHTGEFWNALSTSLLATIEIDGTAGSFEARRKVVITVTEGKRVKLTRTTDTGLLGDGGKYYVPVWLYSSMCSTVTIKAHLVGQRTTSTMTKRIGFMCGE